MLENAHGRVDVWRVENFEKVLWPESMFGHFFGGDCFLVLYTYTPRGREVAEQYMLYIWQVRALRLSNL